MAQDELAALGEHLRQARLERDVTLREAEIALKIRAKFLEGIENGQPDPSLSEMQVRGFLRNYAVYLRLDPNAILLAYEEAKRPKRRGLLALGGSKHQTATLTPTPQRTATQPIPIVVPNDANTVTNTAGGRSLTRTLLIGLLALLLVGMMAGGVYILLSEVNPDSNEVLVNPQIEASPTVVNNETNFEPAASLTPTLGVVLPTVAPNFVGADALNINVTATQRSWLRITVDDVVQFQGVLRPGTGIQLSGQTSIRLRTSNAGGLEVTINNQPLGILGGHSQEYDQTFTLDNQPPTPTSVPTLTPFITQTGASSIIQPSATQVGIASTTTQPTNSNPNAPTALPTMSAFSTETTTPTLTLTPTPITPTVTPTLTPTVTLTPTETLAMPDRVTRTPRP